jgi:hypothetical protein
MTKKFIILLFVFVGDMIAQERIAPILSVTGLENAALLTWDSLAQAQSHFSAYRVYRGRLRSGPWTRLREWKRSSGSVVPNQFMDVGDDDSDGVVLAKEILKNDIVYYYRVSALLDSSVNPPASPSEEFSEIISVVPLPAATGFANGSITLVGETGIRGNISRPRFTITNPGNFDRLFAGHRLNVKVTTINTTSWYLFPVVVTDQSYTGNSQFFMDYSLSPAGDSASAGVRGGTFVKDNLFGFGSLAISFDWQFEQLSHGYSLDTIFLSTKTNDSTDTAILYRDTVSSPFVGIQDVARIMGEKEYEVEFLAGGLDTVNLASRRIYRYLNVRVREVGSGLDLTPGGIPAASDVPGLWKWTISRWSFDAVTGSDWPLDQRKAANRYYLPTDIDSSKRYLFSNSFYIESVRFVCDFANKGRFIGRPWPLVGREGTHDFSVGDKIRIVVSGGVSGAMPYNAEFNFAVGHPTSVPITSSVLDQIRVVPNPYIVRHEAQLSPGERRILFHYLPEHCVIRIYTVGLDLVKTITHDGGGTDQWDLRTAKGDLVGSQLFVAHFETSDGASTIKKFAVVVGE